jgi:hypothetical protein
VLIQGFSSESGDDSGGVSCGFVSGSLVTISTAVRYRPDKTPNPSIKVSIEIIPLIVHRQLQTVLFQKLVYIHNSPFLDKEAKVRGGARGNNLTSPANVIGFERDLSPTSPVYIFSRQREEAYQY